MARLIVARAVPASSGGSILGKFFAGLVIVNVAGAAACWILATKYPEESFSAALWGLGALIGYLAISVQALHVLAPAQSGNFGLGGRAAIGVLALNMLAWLLGGVISMGVADGPALLEDFRLVAGGIWDWARELLA